MNFKLMYEKLEKDNFIDYGKIIPTNVIEELFEVAFVDDWPYRGPLLALKAIIEDEGFLCTTSNCENGSLKILELEEMHYKAECIFRNITKKLKRTMSSMLKADISTLNEYEKSKHSMTANKLVIGLQAQKSALANY